MTEVTTLGMQGIPICSCKSTHSTFADATLNYVIFSVVEVNVSIMCSCMPSYATCLRHHLPTLRSFQYRIRSRFYSSNKQDNSSSKFGRFGREDSDHSGDNPGENMKLTLGSAIRGGQFLQTQHVQRKEWPLETVDEGERRTPQMTGRGVREEYRESSIA